MRGRLRSLLNWVYKDKLKGASLADSNPYELVAECDPASFISALKLLNLPSGVLALESSPEDAAVIWLKENASRDGLRIHPGTIWPKPDWWYLPLDPAILDEFAALIDKSGTNYPAIHLFVYEAGKVLLEWYDAFDEPMHIARELDGPMLHEFAKQVGGKLTLSLVPDN